MRYFPIAEVTNIKMRSFISLLLVYVTVALVSGTVLSLFRFFQRQELQTINRRFEIRPWLAWSSKSLERLNLPILWQYHQDHEMPRQWWAWDYTLSWLLEFNHPPVQHKVVIFNHLLEDEPPAEAIAEHPWMQPLLHHPLSRRSVADMIEFLAKSGARLIILDNDFPQYTIDDLRLAQSIHEAASGHFGKPVPVFMARTINRRSSGSILQLEVPSQPSGVLQELSKLEPGVDVTEKYTGITGILPDEDQVIRRLALRLPGLAGKDHESIILKALRALGEAIPPKAPDVLDIDFAVPPNSELYPVRPLSYLLDPERKRALAHPTPESTDVSLTGAIVVIGDGVIDVFNTPYTNEGVNQMSGPEVLIRALETLCRGQWPHRLEGFNALVYIWLTSIIGGLIWVTWKALQQITMSSFKSIKLNSLLRTVSDLLFLLIVLAGNFLIACIIFAFNGLIVPVFVPALCLGLGTVGSLLWEREREREETFLIKLQSAKERLEHARQQYEADLRRQEAEAKSREVLLDRERRHEFVRRINHDLNAPVSVLNWTLSELQEEDVSSVDSQEKVGRLVKTSDKLCELVDQLVRSYEYETSLDDGRSETTNLTKVIDDTLDLQRPFAQMHESRIDWSLPETTLWVRANALELSRIIDNLVRNALKHNPSGTSVNVTVDTAKGEHIIVVADNGKGIAPEHLKHIFEPGYRVDPNRKDSQGLGLDIVKTLVERLGGHISVVSRVGEGTAFSIGIPVCTPPLVQGKLQNDVNDNPI